MGWVALSLIVPVVVALPHPRKMTQCQKIELSALEFKLVRHAPFTHIERRFGVLRDNTVPGVWFAMERESACGLIEACNS